MLVVSLVDSAERLAGYLFISQIKKLQKGQDWMPFVDEFWANPHATTLVLKEARIAEAAAYPEVVKKYKRIASDKGFVTKSPSKYRIVGTRIQHAQS